MVEHRLTRTERAGTAVNVPTDGTRDAGVKGARVTVTDAAPPFHECCQEF